MRGRVRGLLCVSRLGGISWVSGHSHFYSQVTICSGSKTKVNNMSFSTDYVRSKNWGVGSLYLSYHYGRRLLTMFLNRESCERSDIIHELFTIANNVIVDDDDNNTHS